MFVNWGEIQEALLPIKDFEDLCHRLQVAFSYSFVRDLFNFSLPNLIVYTESLLRGDSRGRYNEYASKLVEIITQLEHAGVQDVLSLKESITSRDKFEVYSSQTRIKPLDIVSVLKYLVYWFIPAEKYLSGLVQDDPGLKETTKVLRDAGIRTNLELLQAGRWPSGRKNLAHASGLPLQVITDMVNRADFSRMPWASKATISNIIGAGYASVSELANADPQRLYADFFRYGESIGKNLKLGNEIENSYRIAKIIPVVVSLDDPS